MEIIHLILGKANPERMNGVNRVVFQLATRQAASGRNVALWGITNELTHNYGEREFETVLFKAKKNPFQIDAALKKAIKKKKGDVIFHLHGGWIPTYSTISSILEKKNIPFVITPHGAYNTIAMQRSKWMKKQYFNFFEKKLLKRAAKIHSIGESEVEGLEKMFPNNKAFLLPYGFEAPKIEPINKNEKSDFIIGFVGRLDIYTKGLDLLLEAFEQFQKSNSNSKLWIVGDSAERTRLEQMIAEKNLKSEVILWGSKFGKEKDDLMQKMTVFVHPSRNEGLPAAVLEASNMGIPSVVSKATNVGAFITKWNAGVAIENEDSKALVDAFVFLYDLWKNKQLDEMSENAKNMVKTAFSWDNIVEDFDKLYQ